MKKIAMFFLAALIVCMCSVLCFTSCSIKYAGNTKAYVGMYTSIFVDSQNDTDTISFSLKINDDKSFVLSGAKTYMGTWKSYTESGKTQLLCLVEEGFRYNESHPNGWNPYFTLCFLDDGTLMATPGMTGNSLGSVSAFGSGSVTMVTLVIFEKDNI